MYVWVLFFILQSTHLMASSDMHKCMNKNGVFVYSDVGCSQGDSLISVNGVSSEELKRIETEKKRIAAEKRKADAIAESKRHHAEFTASASEYKRQIETGIDYAAEARQKQKWLQNGNYKDYPERLRYYNPNTDSKCREIVSRMRALENDPRWEYDAATQRRWSNLVTIATNNNCRH